MRRIVLFGSIVSVAFALLVPLSGCQKVAEKAAESAVEKATGVKVDADEDKVTFTDEDGSTAELSSEGGDYPSGFPEDFPRYEGAKIEGALKNAQNGKEAFTVTFTTPDATADVFAWYLEEVAAEGWTVESQLDATAQEDAYAMLTAAKGDTLAAITVSRSASDSETSVIVGLNPKE